MSDRTTAPLAPEERPDAELEASLTGWLDARGRPDAAELATVRASIATLPARRSGRGRAWVGLAAAAVVVAVIGGVVLSGRLAPPSGAGASGDPAAFAGDPRLAACTTAHVAEPARVFEMTHAQWFPLYFPGWWKGAPELEVDDPALVVIGREQRWPVLGAAPQPGQTVDPDAGLGYQMCIAVGPTSGFIVHDYGVTRFDRIVPVLSDADVARAANLDPDVLADPAAWLFPERLAPCGGLTGNELYIFELSDVLEFRRYFPRAAARGPFDTAEPGIVIVYRDPLPLLRRAVNSRAGEPGIHDICVVFEGPAGDGRAATLPEVDITGFHLRVDGPRPAPDPSVGAPSGPTPTPAPAWTAGASALLGCDGLTPGPISGWARGRLGTTDQDTAEHALNDLVDRVRETTIAFPLAGFRLADQAPDAVVYAYALGGSFRAAVVLRSEAADGGGPWFVADAASCAASELGDLETGVDLGDWRDASGTPVPADVITERQDCYDGIKLTVNGRLFVWDPDVGLNEVYDPAQLDVPLAADVSMPVDAIDTGFWSGDRRLFLAENGSAAFIVRASGIQRWPHVKGDSYQRTDCN